MSFGIYNPVNSTHRGRVIETKTIRHQLEQAKLQATEKLDHLMSDIVPGTTARGSVVLTDGVVTKITLSGYGTGYTTASVVVGGGGTGAIATANIDSNGTIQSITVTNGGEGYTVGDAIAVTITGDGSKAIATATVYDGVITSVNITYEGDGYVFPPIISFSSPQTPVFEATAITTISNGKVSGTIMISGGSGYNVPIYVDILAPHILPTLAQRTLLYDAYYKDFLGGITKPIDIINARFSQGKLVQAKETGSLTTITNPIVAYGNRDVQKKVPLYQTPNVPGPDNPSECYFSIHNDGKEPSQEYLFTHNRRVDRNENANHLLAKANETVLKQVEAIVATGGRGAVLTAQTPAMGALPGIDVTVGGQYYTTNPPTITITRRQDDPGRVKATAVVSNAGIITSVLVTNSISNNGFNPDYPPKVTVDGNAELKIVASDISGTRVITINVVDGGSGYSQNVLPIISVDRLAPDPGIATAVVGTIQTGNVLDHGAILTITMTETGTGYNIDYPPIIKVSGGKGSVSSVQKAQLLKEVLGKAFDHLKSNWGGKASDHLTSTLNAKGSSSLITRSRSLHVVDVDDPLLRSQRLKYKDSDIILDSKAKETALARYDKAVLNGEIPDEPAIPSDPIPPVATITSATGGSGAILRVYVNRDGILSTGHVSGVEVISGGSDYPDSPPIINITGGGPDAYGAFAYPEVTSGAISDIHLIYGGVDYTEVPEVNIFGGGGKEADFNATIDLSTFTVDGFTSVNGGSEYVSISFTGGGGTGAKALVHTHNGSVIGIEITDNGSGYNLREPPNSNYLKFLKDAETTPESREKDDPNYSIPVERIPGTYLPEPTLKPSKDIKGFLNNQSIQDRNTQRTSAKRANSSIIQIAQLDRKYSYDTWLAYLADKSSVKLKIAFDALVTAGKSTVAAQNLKKWRPVPKDPYMQHKNELYTIYRASIPAWIATDTYKFGDLVNYSVNDKIYRVIAAHRPADVAQLPSGIWLVNPITYLGKYYQLYPIKP